MDIVFEDRKEAGKKLAGALQKYVEKPDVVVVGLAKGGIVVAAEVADMLHLPLDLLMIRKIGAPNNEELALGAIADEGEGVFNDHLISILGVSKEYLRKEVERQKEIVKQRKQEYLKGYSPPPLEGKTVILVDDGIATGASMKVAVASIRSRHVRRIVLAVPVAAPDSLEELKELVDEVVCLSTPLSFGAVGRFYKSFPQTTDKEIIALLQSL